MHIFTCEGQNESVKSLFSDNLNSKDKQVLKSILNSYKDIFYEDGEDLLQTHLNMQLKRELILRFIVSFTDILLCIARR